MYNVPACLVIVGFSSDSEIPSKGAEIRYYYRDQRRNTTSLQYLVQ